MCAQILCKRAAAFVSLGARMKGSPSDAGPEIGPDAETLSGLALRDANKTLDIESSW